MRTSVKAGLVAATLMAAAPLAHALSEWWTPPNASCPTFDSEDSCESFCRTNPDRCGGQSECTWKTGDQRPQC
jgi:hypothetical protein